MPQESDSPASADTGVPKASDASAGVPVAAPGSAESVASPETAVVESRHAMQDTLTLADAVMLLSASLKKQPPKDLPSLAEAVRAFANRNGYRVNFLPSPPLDLNDDRARVNPDMEKTFVTAGSFNYDVVLLHYPNGRKVMEIHGSGAQVTEEDIYQGWEKVRDAWQGCVESELIVDRSFTSVGQLEALLETFAGRERAVFQRETVGADQDVPGLLDTITIGEKTYRIGLRPGPNCDIFTLYSEE